jgi:membrane protein
VLNRIFGPLARRWPWVATALRMQERFGEVKGGYLASAVTLNLFLSLFPLLLVAIAVVGFITDRSTDIPTRIIDNLGITSDSTREVFTNALNSAAHTRKAASIIGFLGLLWSSLGVVAAIEYALDATWQITGRGIKDKLRGLAWSIGALIILGISVAVTTLANVFADGSAFAVLSALIAIVVNTGFWMWTFLILSYHRLPWRGFVPGAIFAGIGLEIIKQVATRLSFLFGGASALYGSVGAIFTIFAVLALFGRLIVYASVLNVVRWEEDHGTVTIDIEVPRVPGSVPLESDRAGAIDPDP